MTVPECNFDYSSEKYWNNIIGKVKNAFWKDVLLAWKDFCKSYTPQNRDDILRSSLWNNENIKMDKKCIFYKNWNDVGIRFIDDLMYPNGTFMSLHDIQEKFNLRINFLTFYGLKSSISKSFSHLLRESTDTLQIPFQSLHMKLSLQETKGCKLFYKVLISSNIVNFKCIQKWNQVQTLQFSYDKWYKMCYYNWKCTNEVKLRWFQFRLLNRILCTNTLLVKIGRADDNLCTFCGRVEESIMHLFWECDIIQAFWRNFEKWVKDGLNVDITLNKDLILFGNFEYQDYIFNNLLLVLKFNIYRCRIQKINPIFTLAQCDLKKAFEVEKYSFGINLNNRKFDTRWHKWKSLF